LWKSKGTALNVHFLLFSKKIHAHVFIQIIVSSIYGNSNNVFVPIRLCIRWITKRYFVLPLSQVLCTSKLWGFHEKCVYN
jgi:hypothetical protein